MFRLFRFGSFSPGVRAGTLRRRWQSMTGAPDAAGRDSRTAGSYCIHAIARWFTEQVGDCAVPCTLHGRQHVRYAVKQHRLLSLIRQTTLGGLMAGLGCVFHIARQLCQLRIYLNFCTERVLIHANFAIEQIEVQFDQTFVGSSFTLRDAGRWILLVAMDAFLVGLCDGFDVSKIALMF
jgi:hypothetical protein